MVHVFEIILTEQGPTDHGAPGWVLGLGTSRVASFTGERLIVLSDPVMPGCVVSSFNPLAYSLATRENFVV